MAGLVGNFSNSLLLDVNVDAGKSFLERVRSMQSTLHETAEHSALRGLGVLREPGHNAGAPVTAPVVYTSGLDLGELFNDEVTEEFGEPVWIISQGPQVVLDAQVAELKGGILLNWDVRPDAFPERVIEAMFAAYRGLLEVLLGAEPPQLAAVKGTATNKRRCAHQSKSLEAKGTDDSAVMVVVLGHGIPADPGAVHCGKGGVSREADADAS